ncbi:MAG: SOS response-associated peptidase family protein [Bacteroidota bacterium]
MPGTLRGFYEYRHEAKLGKKGQPLKATETFPYRVGLKDSEVFYMAAIWQPWTDAETGEYVESMAIVTTASNSLMSQIHNVKKRMPTVLTEDLAWEWLFGDLNEKRITEIATFQIPSSAMEAYTIDKQFRTAEDPLVPCEYPLLPALVFE